LSYPHELYKIPLKKVKIIVDNRIVLGPLSKCINGAIKGYKKDHGPIINERSLTKRILGAIKEHNFRLLCDRHILNWLCVNRIDLGKINGELRNALADKIKNEET